ncbi:MAG: glycosyltransferase family 2 protein [Bacteroidales bacterium]|nr:glycosyltransferase family 2 protein [Bacteroidales bacterium]MCF8336527.1 glycosyltransferase family 2 protein [Bacteroidales bacterium]
MKKKHPLVSIVTVNYNQSEVTCQLIDSLEKITYPNIEIIVVDNASVHDNPEIIKERYPNVVLIKNPINYGFAAGNNMGIMASNGEYVLFLNNDTVVRPNFLEPLIKKFQNIPDAGAVSPKIRYFHTPHTIQYAGYTKMTKYTIRNFALGYQQEDLGTHDADRKTFSAHGAAMMVPMEVIKKIGMMSYIFFLYYEEADFCERIRRAGYSIHYVHNSLIYHKESISTGKTSSLKIYYLYRNRIVYMRRNIFGKAFYIALLYQLFVAIPKNAFAFLLRGKVKLFLAFYRAIGWHINHMFDKTVHENPML